MYVKNICHTNQVPTMCTPLPYICPSRMLYGVQSINFFEKKIPLSKALKMISFFQRAYTYCLHVCIYVYTLYTLYIIVNT